MREAQHVHDGISFYAGDNPQARIKINLGPLCFNRLPGLTIVNIWNKSAL